MSNVPEIVAPAGAVALREDHAAAVAKYVLADKSEATRAGYRSDFRMFDGWCRQHGYTSVPADPATVAGFLAAQADAGIRPATSGRQVAAIRYVHELGGHVSPTGHKKVRAAIDGIRRTKGTKSNQKAPATAERISAMLAAIPTDTLKGKRDRALLALGFAGAFRRSELVALDVADLVFETAGMRVKIRRSKTDQEGQGQEIAIPRGKVLQPVRAVQEWLKAAGIDAGPVFRGVDKHGHLKPDALTPQSVALVVKAYAEATGLDPADFAGHSLRAGFLTSAAEQQNPDLLKMMEVSRHRQVETVKGYVRSARLFQRHAGDGFL